MILRYFSLVVNEEALTETSDLFAFFEYLRYDLLLYSLVSHFACSLIMNFLSSAY